MDSPTSRKRAAQFSALAYIAWGLLHFQAAYSVYLLGAQAGTSMVQARLVQSAWNLAGFSVAAIGIAATLNWRNSRLGFWANLAVVSVADLGFVLFVLWPGWIPAWPGAAGPALWIAAAVASAWALPRHAAPGE